MKTRYAHDYACLPSWLDRHGYRTEFVIGQHRDLNRLQTFMARNGLQRLVSESDFPPDAERIGLGMSDGALFSLLRARLEERAKASRAERAPERQSEQTRKTDPVEALAAAEGVADRQLKRALIEHILADHFGPALLNEARFQQIAERVTETLEADPESHALMMRVVKDLRASAR